MIALISVILLLGFLITNLSYYYVSKNSLRDTLITELPLTSNNIYSEIQRDLLRPIFISSLMANDTFVKDWLSEGEQDVDKITRYLDEIRRQYGVFTSFLVSDATLNYYHFSGLNRTVKKSIPTDQWYYRVKEMQPSYEINVDLNPEQNHALTIFTNYKVNDDQGRYMGATGVGLNFNTVADIVSRYEKNFGHHVYFIDPAGNIAIRSSQAYVQTDSIYEAPGLSDIAPQVLSREQGFFEYRHDGRTLLVSSRYIPELDWWVLVEYDEAVALASIRHSLFINILIGLAVVIITILITNYIVNRFQRRLEKLATTDKLTGIGNRTLFDLMLPQALQRRQRDAIPLSVIIIDIDNFKQINDNYGHMEGDRAIQQIADIICSHTRKADLLCRWGGEELILLAHGCDRDNAVKRADEIRRAVAQAEVAHYADGSAVTLSCGITEVLHTDDIESILRRADRALYAAKHAGRNCVIAL